MNPGRPSAETVELQTRIGFLERTVEDLNEVVLGQGREIERLARGLAALEARLAVGQDDGEEDDAADLALERPPHY